MNILIVEDDENKRIQLINFLNVQFPNIDINIAKSFQSGLRAIINDLPDLIILDMTMPTFDIGVNEDGGRPQALAGREILRQMLRRSINIPVIVVTQFDRFGEGADMLTLEELDEKLYRDHQSVYFGAVYYDITFEGWKEKLSKKLSTIFPCK